MKSKVQSIKRRKKRFYSNLNELKKVELNIESMGTKWLLPRKLMVNLSDHAKMNAYFSPENFAGYSIFFLLFGALLSFANIKLAA